MNNTTHRIPESELILNDDGSIYHLHLLPSDIAQTIILVGDPERVAEISCHFESIEIKKQKREIVTHTGHYKGKRITVISTGMGTDNIDIVLHELDALTNIDLETRAVKEDFKQLTFVRIGTSGALQKEIAIDSFLISTHGLGLDGMLLSYQKAIEINDVSFVESFTTQTDWATYKATPYLISADENLVNHFEDTLFHKGITATLNGFYGPQGRVLRLPLDDANLIEKMSEFSYQNKKITNLEMETAGIYGLSKLMGHRAISLNCILANRIDNVFSTKGKEKINELILLALSKIETLD